MTTQSTTGAGAPGYTVDVTKKLVQDYEVGSSFSKGGYLEVTPVTSKYGKLSLGLRPDGVPAAFLCRSPDSDTGWVQKPLAITDDVHQLLPVQRNGETELGAVCDTTLYVVAFDADGNPQYPINQTVGNPSLTSYWSPAMSLLLQGILWDDKGCVVVGYSTIDEGMYPLGTLDNGVWTLLQWTSDPWILEVIPPPATAKYPALILSYADGLYTYAGTSQYEASPWPRKPVLGTLTKMPTLPGVTNLCVVSAGADRVECIAVDGTNKVYSLMGTYNADGTIVWAATWSVSFLPGTGLAIQNLLGTADAQGAAHLLMMDGNGILWLTHQDQATFTFTPPAEVWGFPVSDFSFCGGANLLDFCFSTPDGHIYYISYDENGESVVEEVLIEGDGEMVDKATYRIGVTIAETAGSNAKGIDVTIESPDSFILTVNGDRHFLRPNQVLAAKTDENGCVWITLDVEDSIAAPVLTLRSTVFQDGCLEIQADAEVEQFLSGVTPDVLLNGQDPRTGTQLLSGVHHDQQDAETICKVIQQIANTSAAVRRMNPSAVPPPHISLTARPGVYWRDAEVKNAFHREDLDALPQANWRFRMVEGRPSFEVLSKEEAGAVFAELRQLPAFGRPKPMGFFDDLWDAVESAWDSVASGISSVYEIVVSGADALVTFVIDGVQQVLTIALDAAGAILNLFNGVFDMLGTLLGTVLGWLLDIIGWLFGWPRILAARDKIKSLIKRSVGSLNGVIADPNVLVTGWINQLEDFRGQAKALFAQFAASPRGSETMDTFSLGLPPGITWLASSGALPESTWLLEKVKQVLPQFGGVYPALPIDGLAAAWSDLDNSFPDLKASVGGLMKGLLSTLGDWITNPTDLGNAALAPVMNIIGQFIDTLIAAIEGLLKGLANVLHIVWENCGKLADWFDSEIYLPFLSAFYSKIVKSDLSMLDVTCLVAAIVAVATGVDGSLPDVASLDVAMGAAAALDLTGITTIMYSLNCFTTFLSSFTTFMIDPDDLPNKASVLTLFLDRAMSIIVSSLLLTGTNGTVWQAVGGAQLGYTVLSAMVGFTKHSWGWDVLLGLGKIIFDIVAITKSNAAGRVVYTVFDFFQMMLTWVVDADRALQNEGAGWKRNVQAALVYGVTQGGLRGAMVASWHSTVSAAAARPGEAPVVRAVVVGG